jgi:hypothetical protein
MVLLFTVTVHVAAWPFDLAVIVAVPAPTAVTFPLASTVATDALLVDQVAVVASVASAGVYVTLRFAVVSISMVMEVLFRLIPVRGLFTVIWTVVSAVMPFSVRVMVTLVVPIASDVPPCTWNPEVRFFLLPSP